MTSLDFPDLSIDSMSLLFYLNDMDKSDCQSAPQHDQSGLVSPEISDWHMNEVFQSIPDIDEVRVKLLILHFYGVHLFYE